jgi:glycosyltransferase involved in cell wall biosynthesis
MRAMWQGQRVSIVFPAYNEEAGIAAAVTDFGDLEAVDEVLVVDNNSRDRTAERAAAAGARVVSETRQGYGNALRRGLADAAGEYIVLAEPDGTFMAKDVLKLLAYADDFDLVLGTRTTRELIWHGANMGWQLRWGNWIVAKLLQVLFGGPSLSDCGCTLRLVRRSAAARLLPRFTVGGSHFLPEMVCLALLEGQRLVEVPVNYRVRVGESKITGSMQTTVRVAARMLALIVRYRLFRR